MKRFLHLLILGIVAAAISLITLEALVRLWPHVSLKFGGKNTINMYIVGESTGFGYPYGPKISYPKIVSYMFGNKILGKDIKLVNLSEPGCKSAEQYWKLFRTLYSSPPQKDSILLIYIGINEWTNSRSIKHPLLKRFMDRSICLSRLVYLLNTDLFLETIDYESRLKNLIALGEEYKLYMIISNLSGNYADFDPADRTILQNQNALLLFSKAADNEKNNKLAIAAGIYRDMLKDKTIAHDHVNFRLGKLLVKLGKYEEAKECFFRSTEENYNLLKPTRYQNKIIEELSRQHEIDFVDIMQLFIRNSPNGMIGNNLFIDAHHPNLKGYILMARAFADKIANHYNVKILGTNPTEAEVMKYLNYDPGDLLDMYVSVAGWTIARTASYTFGANNFDRAEYYLSLAWELYKKSDKHYDIRKLYTLQFMLSAFKGDSEKAVFWLNKSELLDKMSMLRKNNKDLYNFWLRLFSGIKIPQNIKDRIFSEQ